VSSVGARVYATAELATRAAVRRQHADLNGAVHDDTIGRLEYVADGLKAAAMNLEPPPPSGPHRDWVGSLLMIAGIAVACVAILSAVPHPAEPWVLALTLGGISILARLVLNTIVSILDRGTARAHVAADPADDGGIEDVFAELRTRIAAITADLEPARYEHHLQAARHIERASAWLD